jgi:hypothetical protein
MMTIEDLIYAELSLVFDGEQLNYKESVWKMYGFLRQFTKPMWPVNDLMETQHVAFIVDDMIANLNLQLKKHNLVMEYSGGNLYVSDS